MHTLYDVINMIAVRNVTDLMDLDHLCHHSVMFMSVRIITNSETQHMHTYPELLDCMTCTSCNRLHRIVHLDSVCHSVQDAARTIQNHQESFWS